MHLAFIVRGVVHKLRQVYAGHVLIAIAPVQRAMSECRPAYGNGSGRGPVGRS